MARWLVLVVLACGCRQIWGLGGTPELAIDASMTPDVPADVAIDASLCFGSFGDAPYCLDAAPTVPLTFGTATNINTQNSTSCSPLFANECVIPATLIEIDNTISVIGTRPLVLISTSVLHVAEAGTLDAASRRGAASNPSICDNGNGPGAAGGGQGGSFGGVGGDGGKGESGGGNAGNAIVPLLLQGGCPGGNGGSGGGAQGNGGGAIYLIAVNQILVDGTIDASGSAGTAGSGMNIRGGGGGGSGGMIVLESPSITVSGTVFANGGSGGGGASLSGNGTNGQDPTGVTSVIGGQGGASSGGGGGSSGIAMPNGGGGFDAPGAGGGGGGGGGAGVIKAIGGTITNLLGVSPTPS